LNLIENLINVSLFKLNPEEYHCFKINLMIKPALLLLSTKKGSDKFNRGLLSDVAFINNGITK
jgi:hypothetical protein